MLKLILIPGCVIVGAIGAAYGYVAGNAPTFNAVVHPCLLREAEHPPTQRLDTCTCLAEETRTSVTWAARAFVLPAARENALQTGMLNTCRARSFQSNIGDRGPARMSPMPLLVSGANP